MSGGLRHDREGFWTRGLCQGVYVRQCRNLAFRTPFPVAENDIVHCVLILQTVMYWGFVRQCHWPGVVMSGGLCPPIIGLCARVWIMYSEDPSTCTSDNNINIMSERTRQFGAVFPLSTQPPASDPFRLRYHTQSGAQVHSEMMLLQRRWLLKPSKQCVSDVAALSASAS